MPMSELKFFWEGN